MMMNMDQMRSMMGGMMGQQDGQPGMMGNMGQMMPMMRQMMMGQQGGMGMPFEHVEGRIAFLKAELKITDAQAPQWNAFADTLRSNAKAHRATHQQMTTDGMPSSWPERLAFQQKCFGPARQPQGPGGCRQAPLRRVERRAAEARRPAYVRPDGHDGHDVTGRRKSDPGPRHAKGKKMADLHEGRAAAKDPVCGMKVDPDGLSTARGMAARCSTSARPGAGQVRRRPGADT